MRRILIGFDGSERGRDAIALGKALADAVEESQVFVATVHAGPREEAERTLEAARGLWPELPDESFRTWRADDDAGGLDALATTLVADVIVLGRRKPGLLGRFVHAELFERIVRQTRRAVALAPPDYAEEAPEPRLRRVGVAYDGSEEAAHALDIVAEIATGAGAALVALEIVETLGPVGDGQDFSSMTDESVRFGDRRLLDGGVTLPPGVNLEERRLKGPLAFTLLMASQELDLLALGPIRRLLHGNVSVQVARRASVPVLLCLQKPVNAQARLDERVSAR